MEPGGFDALGTDDVALRALGLWAAEEFKRARIGA